MFTLSTKQRILNSAQDVVVRDAAGAVVNTQAGVSITDTIEIDGFGKFALADMTAIKLHRGRPAVAHSQDWGVVVPNGTAIGDAIEVKVTLKSERYSSEIQNDFIGGSAPIVFQTAPLAAVNAGSIRAAIVAAYSNFRLQHHMAVFAMDVLAGTAATSIRSLAETGYESVTVEKIEIRRSNQGLASQPFITLAAVVAATDAAGTQGLGTGKYLEESVRMATPLNMNPYGIDTTGNNPDLRGLYTEMSFTINAPYFENISTLAADHGSPLPASASFTLWFNEATMLGANNVISLMAEAAIDVATAVTGIDTTAQTAPLTAAQERAEALIIANGNSVPTAALFIA